MSFKNDTKLITEMSKYCKYIKTHNTHIIGSNGDYCNCNQFIKNLFYVQCINIEPILVKGYYKELLLFPGELYLIGSSCIEKFFDRECKKCKILFRNKAKIKYCNDCNILQKALKKLVKKNKSKCKNCNKKNPQKNKIFCKECNEILKINYYNKLIVKKNLDNYKFKYSLEELINKKKEEIKLKLKEEIKLKLKLKEEKELKIKKEKEELKRKKSKKYFDNKNILEQSIIYFNKNIKKTKKQKERLFENINNNINELKIINFGTKFKNKNIDDINDDWWKNKMIEKKYISKENNPIIYMAIKKII